MRLDLNLKDINPELRNFSEQHNNGFLIRINPDEPQIPSYVQGAGFPFTGLLGLQSLITK